ncbi:hypothetical protein FDUTEX481_01620 [Tolypothrix sp. PCC 7601]|nr:hypothetical protein FDUTEX481_01620 [Tolypothrix sp. PCC 7601]
MRGNFPQANIALKAGNAYRTRLSLLGEVEKLGESPNFVAYLGIGDKSIQNSKFKIQN